MAKKLEKIAQNSTIAAIKYGILQSNMFPYETDSEKTLVKNFYPVKQEISNMTNGNDKEELKAIKEYCEVEASMKILDCKYTELYSICSEIDGWFMLIKKLMKKADYIASHKDHYGYKTIVEGEYNGIRFLLNVLDGMEGIVVKRKEISKLLK